MSHSANAHNLPDGAGLRRLAPGESLSGSIRLKAEVKSQKASRVALSDCSTRSFLGSLIRPEAGWRLDREASRSRRRGVHIDASLRSFSGIGAIFAYRLWQLQSRIPAVK